MIQITHPSQIGDIVELQAGADASGRPAKRRGIEDGPIDIEDEDEDGVGDDGYGDRDAGEGLTQGNGSNGMWTKKMSEIPESECDFTSILELRNQVKKRENPGKSSFTNSSHRSSDATWENNYETD
jgi:hypothetical protein